MRPRAWCLARAGLELEAGMVNSTDVEVEVAQEIEIQENEKEWDI